MDTKSFSLQLDAGRHLAELTLANPADSNRLSDQDIAALATTIRTVGENRDVNLLVIRAQGDNFCSGRKPGPKPATPPDAFAVRDRVASTIMAFYASVRSAPIPVIGVVQGEASGFGCAFAAQCDITVASSNATFSLPELNHDFPPTLAMSALLHKVPPKVLTRMVYTRCTLTAEQALQFGLISEVVAPNELSAATERTIAALADRSRLALGTIKEYLSTAQHVDQTAAAKLAENMISVAIASNA